MVFIVFLRDFVVTMAVTTRRNKGNTSENDENDSDDDSTHSRPKMMEKTLISVMYIETWVYIIFFDWFM